MLKVVASWTQETSIELASSPAFAAKLSEMALVKAHVLR